MNLKSLFTRYALLLLLPLSNFYIFYLIFTPLTIHPVFFLFSLFFNAQLSQETIALAGTCIKIIPACVAGSAYYLLLMLNLSTPKIQFKKRLLMIATSLVALLLINILRIFFLGTLSITFPEAFDFTHKLFWYLLSIVFVVGIWVAQIKILKIKQIPFYSDLKDIYSKSSLKK